MPLSFFESEGDSPQKETPFIEEYVKENPDCIGEVYEVEEVVRTRKSTGYILKTSAFIVFKWNRDKALKLILEALQHYVNEMHGYKLVIQVTDKSPYYLVGCDSEKPTNWFGGNGRYTQREIIISGLELEEEGTGNPFLISPPHSAHQNGNGKKKRQSAPTLGKTTSSP